MRLHSTVAREQTKQTNNYTTNNTSSSPSRATLLTILSLQYLPPQLLFLIPQPCTYPSPYIPTTVLYPHPPSSPLPLLPYNNICCENGHNSSPFFSTPNKLPLQILFPLSYPPPPSTTPCTYPIQPLPTSTHYKRNAACISSTPNKKSYRLPLFIAPPISPIRVCLHTFATFNPSRDLPTFSTPRNPLTPPACTPSCIVARCTHTVLYYTKSTLMYKLYTVYTVSFLSDLLQNSINWIMIYFIHFLKNI